MVSLIKQNTLRNPTHETEGLVLQSSSSRQRGQGEASFFHLSKIP
jgi:hypothetical protein